MKKNGKVTMSGGGVHTRIILGGDRGMEPIVYPAIGSVMGVDLDQYATTIPAASVGGYRTTAQRRGLAPDRRKREHGSQVAAPLVPPSGLRNAARQPLAATRHR